MLNKLITQKSNFILPDLPYDQSALEPHISGKTLSFHYGKHHQGYVNNLNNLIKDNAFADMGLEQIITESYHKPDKIGIYNNAAQVWNHAFFWQSMQPNGGGSPSGKLAEQIKQDFGSLEKFSEEFTKAAVSQFGSGWAWLVLDKGKLSIVKTGNADLPMVIGKKALMTVDVWEHSYYLDYQNRRPDYVNVFVEKLINWKFVEENFASSPQSK
jgi:Fe-Mn family superoxide dismutase